MAKVALLDGDSWVYRCGFAAEKTHYLSTFTPEEGGGPEVYGTYASHKEAKAALTEGMSLWTRKEIEPLENCLQMVKSSLENTINVTGAVEHRLYLSGRRNFRDDIYSDYKANRDTATRPKYFRDIRDYLVGQWGGVICDGIEADDAVGIDACDLGDRSVVVAVDKDLDQIPGEHYNWTDGKVYRVTARDGMRFFYEQLLSGDPTDNIPGITGIGPVKARKALEACTSPQDCARVAFAAYAQQAGGADPRADIERNASLLWIQRKINDRHPFWKHYGS